jgi:hypothetical protein
MKRYIFAGLAAVVATGALVGSAPQANAGCQYGGIAVSKCDGPVQPDWGLTYARGAWPSTTHRRTSTIQLIPPSVKDKMTKRYMTAALGAALVTAGLTAMAPAASAGCIDPGWGAHPFAQMCDSPVNSDGMWERCLSYHNGGPYSPTETDCYTMSAGDPPKEGDPILQTPPTHIDP